MKNKFDKKRMEEMCDNVKPCAILSIKSFLEDRTPGESNLKELIDAELVDVDSHLQQGIKECDYNPDSIEITETPLQYPSWNLIKAAEEGKKSQDLLGPMTGVFVHVFGGDKYIVHVRGKGVSAPGKIQIVSGMGDYGVYPSDLALKEVLEEVGVNATSVLPHNQFLDVTPFMKAGKFPQPLFSYITTGNLDKITNYVKNNAELERFKKTISQDRISEAYPFAVPIENLRDFVDEIDSIGKNEQDPNGKFYGPIKRTCYNFLDWYNFEYKTNY